MNALFDSAALAIVAYAHVAADGSSTGTNSGVLTTKQNPGLYSVSLSTVMAQECDRDLILVQPTSTASQLGAMSNVFDGGMATKLVQFSNASTTAVDTSFAIIILRTTITPPAGAAGIARPPRVRVGSRKLNSPGQACRLWWGAPPGSLLRWMIDPP